MSRRFCLNGYNPDILTCLANLSADEVFTPPKLASAMLDILPQDLFRRPDTKFLDPACKSGVFLREIASRLNDGLRDQMPDDQARINHILTKQVFGLAITELTALLSRRSVYCSKKADGRYSIVTAFTKPDGNICLPKTQHTWNAAGRCEWCNAHQGEYERDETLEAYAYPFIHGIEPMEVFNVKFDVIIGNPPYQMGSDGGTRDVPIYHKFVDQAKKLEPRYLAMVIPSRWMAGGLGLDEFRKSMLNDRRIRKLVDYPTASEVFPGVEIKGGVCYFLWERHSEGDCAVTTVRGSEVAGPAARCLGEHDVLVRDAEALRILKKVLSKNERPLSEVLSARTAFGVVSNFSGYRTVPAKGDVRFYATSTKGRVEAWIARDKATHNSDLVDRWKAMITKAYGAGEGIPHQILGQPWIAEPPSICTQSFLFVCVDSREQAESVSSYYRTRFLRFLVSLRKITQDTTRETYLWVPQQPWDRKWTDEELYRKYGIMPDDIAFIESRVRSME
jgi:site-specific DNA-methyltransferase (adenine-specific)